MTLPTSTRVTDPYETDGVQRDFEFDFPAFYNADTGHYGIEVRRLTELEYEVIDKSLYDIFLNDEDKSGYVRFHVAPMAGDDIYIAGDTTRSQQLNLINYGRYSAQSIEKAFDLIVALIQEFVSKVDEETRQRILADQALRDFLLIKFNQFTAEVTTKIDKHIGDINGFISSLIPMFVCIMRKEIANYAETGMMQVINDFMDNEIEPLITEKVNSYLDQTDFAGAVNQVVAPIAEYVPLPFDSQKTYEVNQRVTLSNGDIVKSTVAGNTVDPNSNMTGWRFDDNTVESISDLIAINNPKTGQVVFVKSYHAELNKGGGLFEYKPTRQSENDGGNIINGWERKVSQTYLNLENYGATGLGLQTYDDHTALKRVEAVVKTSNQKAFVIHAPEGDYTVGKQSFTSGVGFTHENGLDISFNTMTDKRIVLQCDNARFKMRDGMFYGVFDKTTKEPFVTEMPFHPNTASWIRDKDKVTIANIGYMLNFDNIKGLVTTGKVSIDGNMDGMTIGGQYGDSGWQITSYGFRVARVERFDVSNIDTFDHCLDGLYVAGMNSTSTPDVFNPNYRGVVRNVTSTRNGRQGCSFAGGQNISWYDCNFADTALPTFKVQSAPRSCFDIEAEVSPIRNARFYNCFFGDSPTTSLVANSANTKDVHFYSCRFVNSLGVVAWVRRPQFKFFNCYFNGYMEGQYTTAIHSDRTVYNDCVFTDDPVVNPNFSDNGRYLINAYGANPIFNNCTINLHKSGFPASAGQPSSLRIEFNNLLINLYGTNRQSSMAGHITMRIRDYRTVKDQWNATIYSRPDSVCVIENLSGEANKITPFGFNGLVKVVTEVLPVSVAYAKPAGVAVDNATGTDDTATKLNSLIASLKAVGYIG